MTTTLNNFLTIRKTRGDVLHPAEYRSIVEMIRGILEKYDYSDLNKGYATLLLHIIDYHNPHHDDTTNFFEVIVQKTYAIYQNMVASPLNFSDFQAQIVPTLSFIELIRRIVINRYLYNQVKSANGSVPQTVQVTLSNEWVGGAQATPVLLSFGSPLASETDFIKLGWSGNTTPFPVIYNAYSLGVPTPPLLLIFETSSGAQYLSKDDTGSGFPVPLSLASNDLTMLFALMNTPSALVSIFTLRNGTDTLKVNMDQNRIVSVNLNGVNVLSSPGAILDGKITVTVTSQGLLSLVTNQSGNVVTQTAVMTFLSQTPFTSGMIGIPYEDLITPAFGLRTLTVYWGYDNQVPVVPAGYAALVDADGSYLTDYDGSFLIDVL